MCNTVENFKAINLFSLKLTIIIVKAASMKLKSFQCIQTFCHTMGFFPSQPNPERTFRLRTALYLLPPILFLVSSVIFLFIGFYDYLNICEH